VLRCLLRLRHTRRGLRRAIGTGREDTSRRRRYLLTRTTIGMAWARCMSRSNPTSTKITLPRARRRTSLRSRLITRRLHSMEVRSRLLEVAPRVMAKEISSLRRPNRHSLRQERRTPEDRTIWIYGRGDRPELSSRHNQDISDLFPLFHTLHIHSPKRALFLARRARHRCGFSLPHLFLRSHPSINRTVTLSARMYACISICNFFTKLYDGYDFACGGNFDSVSISLIMT